MLGLNKEEREILYETLENTWFFEKIIYMIDWKKRESVNVSKWLKSQLESPILDQLIVENGWYLEDNDDRLAVKVLKWVMNNIKYVSDKVQYRTVEHWATIDETLASRKADCEDAAVLIFLTLRRCGVPDYRISLVAGSVKGGGHAWCRFVSEEYPYTSVYLDWCYDKDRRGIKYRAHYSDYDSNIIGTERYLSIWFRATGKNGFRWKKR